MSDLAAWLLAQLDEAEQVARAATNSAGDDAWATWSCPDDPRYGTRVFLNGADSGDPITEFFDGRHADAAAHIARHDPAHVLADIAAKRRIVTGHEKYDANRSPGYPSIWKCQICLDLTWASEFDPPTMQNYPCTTLRLLALPYAKRPGYDPAWTPEETP